jgi:hypothetical protein
LSQNFFPGKKIVGKSGKKHWKILDRLLEFTLKNKDLPPFYFFVTKIFRKKKKKKTLKYLAKNWKKFRQLNGINTRRKKNPIFFLSQKLLGFYLFF